MQVRNDDSAFCVARRARRYVRMKQLQGDYLTGIKITSSASFLSVLGSLRLHPFCTVQSWKFLAPLFIRGHSWFALGKRFGHERTAVGAASSGLELFGVSYYELHTSFLCFVYVGFCKCCRCRTQDCAVQARLVATARGSAH